MTSWSSSRSREGVEDRRDAAQLQRVRAEEHQVVQDPVQLGEQRPHPHRALGHLHAEHALDGEDDAQLVGEGGEPVVAVGEHDDLAVVARLEELLRAAVHIADDRLGVLDPLAVQDEPQPQHAVRGRVLGADVEHHVGALRGAADADRGLRHGSHGHSVSYVRWRHGDGEHGDHGHDREHRVGGRAGVDRAAAGTAADAPAAAGGLAGAADARYGRCCSACSPGPAGRPSRCCRWRCCCGAGRCWAATGGPGGTPSARTTC